MTKLQQTPPLSSPIPTATPVEPQTPKLRELDSALEPAARTKTVRYRMGETNKPGDYGAYWIRRFSSSEKKVHTPWYVDHNVRETQDPFEGNCFD